MIRLYSAVQVDRGFTRGVILTDEQLNDGVMDNNPDIQLGEVVATAPTANELRPLVEQWQATASTPKAPNAKYAVLAVGSNGKLRYVG